jgi:hypothetical protein
MTAIEYIKLEPEEQFYGKKDLLELELDFLLMVKKFEEFKQIRKQKRAISQELFRRVNKLKKVLNKLDEDLPEVPDHDPKPAQDTTDPTLDSEIESIRQKLEVLEDEIEDY